MLNKINFPGFFVVFFFQFLSPFVSAQRNSLAIAKADTSNFSPNKQGGWQIINSYVGYYQKKDSVSFEVLLQHDKVGVDWSSDQYIGNIKSKSLMPLADKVITYYLLSDKYSIRINRNGNCYISLSQGALPTDDPQVAVIPVQVKYTL